MKTFLNAFGFLTIFKVNKNYYLKEEKFWEISYYFPLVGLVIGLIIVLFFYAFNFIFPPFLSIIFCIGIEVLITGAMHIDGFSDTIDGIFCGESNKDKIHEIMKRSDIGAFAVIAIIFLFILKFSFFYLLITNLTKAKDNILILLFLSFMPAFSRLSINYSFKKYGNLVKKNSLANSFINKNNKKVFTISSIYLLSLFIVLILMTQILFKNLAFSQQGLFYKVFNFNNFFNFNLDFSIILILLIKLILILILIYLFYYLILKFFIKKTGILSGDIIGATVEITEVIYLFFGYLVFKFL